MDIQGAVLADPKMDKGIRSIMHSESLQCETHTVNSMLGNAGSYGAQ